MLSSLRRSAAEAPTTRRPRLGRLLGYLICGFLLALPLLLHPHASGRTGAPQGAVSTLRSAAAAAAQSIAETLRPVQRWAHGQSRVTLFAVAAVVVCLLAYIMLRE